MVRRGSKSRLTPKQAENFTGDTLFDRIARAVCRAGTLPAKELFEAWETARRVRRRYRGGRVLDLACGHGLLAHVMLLLDDTSPCAVAVDTAIPKNASILSQILIDTWPRLAERIEYRQAPLESIHVRQDDRVVSVHACGTLTDQIIHMAMAAGAAVAVLPCCHDLGRSDTGGLTGWMDGPLAVDAVRALKMRAGGYSVTTARIPADITPKNRLLMGHQE
ncbi:MAG: methyltransferase [Desulfobacterales bacterium]|nr:methyltransferase [Desulfobacterales bacterium]